MKIMFSVAALLVATSVSFADHCRRAVVVEQVQAVQYTQPVAVQTVQYAPTVAVAATNDYCASSVGVVGVGYSNVVAVRAINVGYSTGYGYNTGFRAGFGTGYGNAGFQVRNVRAAGGGNVGIVGAAKALVRGAAGAVGSIIGR